MVRMLDSSSMKMRHIRRSGCVQFCRTAFRSLSIYALYYPTAALSHAPDKRFALIRRAVTVSTGM